MKHLNYEERRCIEKMVTEGIGVRRMGKILKRSHSSIRDEISRNKMGYEKKYCAETAHERFLKRQNNKGNVKKLERDEDLKRMIIKNLNEDFSPEQTAGLITLIGEKKICYETIYQFIYSEEGRRLKLWLRLRHRKYPRRQKRGTRKGHKVTIKERKPIEQRPRAADIKAEIGHLETDTIIFSKQRRVVSVQADRKTQKCAITILENKTAEETKYALQRAIEDEYGAANVKTITHDNGTENAKHMEIRDEYEIGTYFCRPYASWQKGLVENINKLIRQYLPRNMNISNLTQEDMNSIQKKLNNRPRKLLHYFTPNQAYQIFLQGGRISA